MKCRHCIDGKLHGSVSFEYIEQIPEDLLTESKFDFPCGWCGGTGVHTQVGDVVMVKDPRQDFEGVIVGERSLVAGTPGTWDIQGINGENGYIRIAKIMCKKSELHQERLI